jgi:large subunit ribosomal protein L4
VTFGPHPRDFSRSLPQKVRHLALRSALSSKAAGDQITLIEDFVLREPKTKEALKMLHQLKVGSEPCLLLTDASSRTLLLATRNIPNLAVRRARDVNTYDVLLAERILLTVKGLDDLKEILG